MKQTRDDEMWLKAQSWCFANDIKIRYDVLPETYTHKTIVDGKKRNQLLNYVRIWISAQGSHHYGSDVYKQHDPALVEKVKEIYLYYYNRSRSFLK